MGSETVRVSYDRSGATENQGGRSTDRTGVDVPDVGLLDPAVQFKHVLVGRTGELVRNLNREVEFFLESRHVGAGGASWNGCGRGEMDEKHET